MYVSASWSVVHAIDVRTGKKIWTFDPEVPRTIGYKGCCDVVNRGVALHKGKIFVGVYDGRLIALDAVTGKKVWEKDTLIDKEHSYTITGAPRVVNGKVVIGNGGAEYARAAMSRRMTQRQAIRHGAGLSFPPIRPSHTKTSRWKRPPRHGTLQANTGSMGAAVRRGTPSPSIPN
jgi:glucose dehydrogenase